MTYKLHSYIKSKIVNFVVKNQILDCCIFNAAGFHDLFWSAY